MAAAVGPDLQPISLDDLAKYSDWPKRLLSLDTFDVRVKTEKEVRREFEDERWGSLLPQVKALRTPALEDVERLYAGADDISPCYDAGRFFLASWRDKLDAHLQLYAKVLAPHVRGASCLVELGAGFGSKLLGLATRAAFADLPLAAGEYTRTGQELISLIATAMKKTVTVGYCDFRTLKLTGMSIPSDAVIFTSYAAHYVPKLSTDFVAFLSQFKPRAVVHFEPCYEHYPENSLHGLMCRRYVELNDYTRNLASVIEFGRSRDGIAVRTTKNVLGSNPFLPISVIEWAPAYRTDFLQ